MWLNQEKFSYTTPEHHISQCEEKTATKNTLDQKIEGIGENAKELAKLISQRASLEVNHVLNDLKIKTITGIAAAFAVTYALFWTLSALALGASPNISLKYSLSAIALFHVVLAAVVTYWAQKPLPRREVFTNKIQKNKLETNNSFHQLSMKTNEIKKIAVENLNPMIKVKRNPEVFLVGSFLLGVALSIFTPSMHGSMQNKEQ